MAGCPSLTGLHVPLAQKIEIWTTDSGVTELGEA